MFATNDPNFTIITPGGCNAKCDFCTGAMNGKPSKDYIKNLARTLAQLPPEIKQVSISGGEPTISRDFMTILWMIKASQRFRKVVLTTNGAKLFDYADQLGGLVNHINISRHGTTDEENNNVFKAGKNGIPTNYELKEIIEVLNKQGIDVTFNRVYVNEEGDLDPDLNKEKAITFVEKAKELGASAVSFRYDQHENVLDETHFETMFSDYAKVNEGGCPVCRSHTCLVSGMPVMFKASLNEPSDHLSDPYELIYHIDGRLCTDWAGNIEYDLETNETHYRPKGVSVVKAQAALELLNKNDVIIPSTQIEKFIAKQPPKMVPRPPKVASLSRMREAYVATGQPDMSGCGVPVTYADCDQGRTTVATTNGCGQPINSRGC